MYIKLPHPLPELNSKYRDYQQDLAEVIRYCYAGFRPAEITLRDEYSGVRRVSMLARQSQG